MLSGLLNPSSETKVIGFDVKTQAEQIKKNIGYMSQRFSLYEDLTVFENMRFYGGIYGLRSKEINSKADDILNILNLINERNVLVKSLPLGWKQKLAFSISILHNPPLVFWMNRPVGWIQLHDVNFGS